MSILDWFCGCPYSAEIASNMAWAEREIRKQEKQMGTMMFGWNEGQWRTVHDWWKTLPADVKAKAPKDHSGIYDDLLPQRYLWKLLNGGFEPPETVVVYPKPCPSCGKPQ